MYLPIWVVIYIVVVVVALISLLFMKAFDMEKKIAALEDESEYLTQILEDHGIYN